MAALGCDYIKKLSGVYAGFEPSYPIAECIVSPSSPEELEEVLAEGRYIHSDGGFFPIFMSYVIYRDGQFKRIGTRDEFKTMFTPITTPEEALGYALVLRNRLSVRYGLEYNPQYEYFVEEIEDTHVEEIDGGYLVHLFFYNPLGCGPHETSEVVVEVTTRGDVQDVYSEAVYKDPAEDDVCLYED
ncbi:MAG: hypothetical protein JXA25_19900 [Anaerolineales bacterium]|nr:hypothetical protein [Anaerolineales bacterium]